MKAMHLILIQSIDGIVKLKSWIKFLTFLFLLKLYTYFLHIIVCVVNKGNKVTQFYQSKKKTTTAHRGFICMLKREIGYCVKIAMYMVYYYNTMG